MDDVVSEEDKLGRHMVGQGGGLIISNPRCPRTRPHLTGCSRGGGIEHGAEEGERMVNHIRLERGKGEKRKDLKT